MRRMPPPSRTASRTSARNTTQQPVRNTTGDTFFAWDGHTLVLNVLGKPAAIKDAIGKPKGTQLKISVTAAPEQGRATEHMLRFLAPLFGVPTGRIEVVFGRESVNKQLRIHAPTQLPAALRQAGCVLPQERAAG